MNGAGSSGPTAAALAARITGRTATRIADDIRRAVDSGVLRAGVRMPTIRALAAELQVSPTTVSEAWHQLTRAGVLRSAGRRGTFVVHPGGMSHLHTASGVITTHLGDGGPDPALLPPLDEAINAGLRAPGLHAHDFAYLTPELLRAVRRTWPFEPEAWTSTEGGSHASFLAISVLADRGGPIALEQPTTPRVHTLLHHRRVPVLEVPWDAHGPQPQELRKALEAGATAFVVQLRGHVPTGLRVTERRLAEMVAVLRDFPDVIVFEDDNLGPLLRDPDPSMGAELPGRVLKVRSYTPAFGLDLRTGVLAGPEPLIRAVNLARGMAGVWTSRILQNALAHLLTDPVTARHVARAGRRYRSRRGSLVSALARHGVHVDGEEGLIIWVPVHSEEDAVERLASVGVVSGPGAPCWFGTPPRPYIRVPTSLLPDGGGAQVNQLAEVIAEVADPDGSVA
ncbi:transcriptional regulator, GntR family [Pseudonocardia thermophila]|uniref:Transcriptional regulator, GntR family n=1 Tax=Pseudonocardia thermophila TaxID=1848 RepID=A0A1M6Q408_PSETH|nr:PLP-dependent aminotransferase family protein [Pseudonocardia thermophila]SHK14881.1 transcriptional regulator, GntR family [Pseudonocardia thermophila]